MEAATQTVCVAAKTASHQGQIAALSSSPSSSSCCYHYHDHSALSATRRLLRMHFWGLDVSLSGTHFPSCVKALTPGRLNIPSHRSSFCQTKYVSLFAAAIREQIFFFLALLCSEYSYHSLFSCLSAGTRWWWWWGGWRLVGARRQQGDALVAF